MPIEIHNLSKSFGERTVLSGFSRTFADGSVTCIIGPSGCGKTTLLRLLGLISPDSGEILGLPERISMVFQENRLIEHLCAETNVRIALPVNVSRERIVNALCAVGLEDSLRRPVRELSGGMKRRVALVRALLSDAPILLMDEPFKGLDADTRASVIRFAKPLLIGKTVLIVTHDPEEAALLDAEICVLA